MRDGITVIWDEYAGIRAALNGVHPQGFYSALVPLWTDSLIVYSASPERVGKIDDSELRQLVVYMNTGLRGHLKSLRQNNALVEDYEQLYRAHGPLPFPSQMERQAETMREYTRNLQKADGELAQLVEKFLAATEAWLRRNRVSQE